MKAKTINEDVHFQRGEKDPRKSIGVGKYRFKNIDDYIAHHAEKRGLTKEELVERFAEAYDGVDADEIFDIFLWMLRETPTEFWMKFIDDELEDMEEDA